MKQKKISKFKKLSSFFLRKETILLSLILTVGFILRFINYDNRWGLASDQARDVIVVNESIARGSLPLIGPFSASGPFVFGPHWYWFNILLTFVTPDFLLVPWIFQGIASTLIGLLAYFIGKKIVSRNFGLLFAFLTTISTAEIAQSTNLTYSTMVGFVSFILLFFIVRYCYQPSAKNLFVVAFLIGLSPNVHFQAIGVAAFVPLIFIFKGISIRKVLVFVLGFILPFIPIIIFDFVSNHFQSRNLLEFLFNWGNSQSLPKRWLTYFFETWPTVGSRIVSGSIFGSYILGASLLFVGVRSYLRKTLPLPIQISFLFFLINFVALRYFKGHLFEAFYVYLHPVILLLSAWAIFELYKIKKIVGISICVLIAGGLIFLNYNEIVNSTNYTAKSVQKMLDYLKSEYSGEKFSIYDFEYKSSHISHSLTMYLQAEDLIDEGGMNIGLILNDEKGMEQAKLYNTINSGFDGYNLYNLSSSSSAELVKSGWKKLSPRILYDSIQYWYLEEKNR